ncbi:beta-phosphoglucomutase [Ferrimonas marina]|uniref:Beta-phosphoglucomutase n=1 Tax=Ferrimonas marina TaxID=299255 RepID=A0A1M5VI71_9GAMM|nr:beta-phosphoglucomutase [Ferrimonas marina]SHH74895.1 beta-phosphoglucomutase [Ferrimonas marina]
MAQHAAQAQPHGIRCCIFDLDGVIVDTAKYHYLAWKRLADSLGVTFTEQDNELLKGVSRVESLKIILKLGQTSLDAPQFEQALVQKNEWYLEYIAQLDASEILPGAEAVLSQARDAGMKIALGSASKNAVLILKRLNLLDRFDAIIDGNKVTHAKPDPEVFLNAASAVDVAPSDCLVFEDAAAGVEAALNAKMKVIGLGEAEVLGRATLVLPDLAEQQLNHMIAQL